MKIFPLNKKVDSPSILHFLGGFRRLSDFVTWFGASPATQWAKDRTFFSLTSPGSSCTAKHHTVSLGTTSWCEKHHLFASFASSDTCLLLFQPLDSPQETPLKNPRGDLGRFHIFSPCRKNVPDILATQLGSQVVETREVMYPKMQNQQKDDVSHTNLSF